MLSKILLTTLGITLEIFVLLVMPLSLQWTALVFLVSAGLIVATNVPNMKKFFLALMIIDLTLNIQKHFLFDPDLLDASRGGMQISVTTIALGILYLLWWFEIVQGLHQVKFFPKITVIALGYVFSCLLSTYNSPNIWMSIFDIFFIMQMIMVYFYTANYIKCREDVTYIVYVLLLCLLIQSTIVVMQYTTGTRFQFKWSITASLDEADYQLGKSIESSFRPTGSTGSANETGGHMAMLLLMMSSLLLYTKNRFKNALVCIVWPMGMAALILTASRGSWISFAVGFVVFLLLALRYRWLSGKKFVAMVVLIAVILGIFSVPIVTRLSEDDRGAARSRIPLMKLAFRMIQEHPFIGIGVNNFSTVIPQYLSSELRGEWLYIVHNQYLLVLAETGYIGLSFFLLIMGIAMHTCLRCIKYNDPLLSPLSIGVVSGIIALSIFMTVELAVSRATVQLFWTMVSIVMASERLSIMDNNGQTARLAPFSTDVSGISDR